MIKRLKQLREERNYTQEYMGLKLGLSQNTYSRIESGQTHLSVDKLREIAEILEVPVWEIMDEKPSFHIHNNEDVKGYVHNLYEYQKDTHEQLNRVYEGTIATLTEQIKQQRDENARLIELLGKYLK